MIFITETSIFIKIHNHYFLYKEIKKPRIILGLILFYQDAGIQLLKNSATFSLLYPLSCSNTSLLCI